MSVRGLAGRSCEARRPEIEAARGLFMSYEASNFDCRATIEAALTGAVAATEFAITHRLGGGVGLADRRVSVTDASHEWFLVVLELP